MVAANSWKLCYILQEKPSELLQSHKKDLVTTVNGWLNFFNSLSGAKALLSDSLP